MTNLSPLVNTRGPIFTHPEGIVLRPVYHVCDLYRSQPAGEVLDAYVRMPSFEAEITSERIGPLPWGDAVATLDRPAGTLALSLANLHPAEPLECARLEPLGRGMRTFWPGDTLHQPAPNHGSPNVRPGAEPARTTTLQELHRTGSMVIAPSVTPAG